MEPTAAERHFAIRVALIIGLLAGFALGTNATVLYCIATVTP